MRAIAVMVTVGVFGCADPSLVPLGGTCTQTFEGEASNCAGQLWCSMVTGHCERRATLGETCGGDAKTPCDDGLLCDHTSTCAAPGPEGTVCQYTQECATGLECNQGYLPDDVGLGECHPLGQAGAPCAYDTYAPPATSHAGCFPGLTCLPPPSPPTLVSIYMSDVVEPVRGFAGTCAVGGTIPMGAACLDATACADGGHCYASPRPLVEPLAMGTLCGPGDCYAGPWPGLCGPGGVPLAPMDNEDCASTACAPGYLCNWQHVCRPRFQGGLLVRCDTFAGVPDDEFCTIGRHCEGPAGEATCVLGAPL